MGLLDRFKKIQDNIATAATKSRRDAKDVTLIAVTKNASPEHIKQLVEAGHYDFGESRVQQVQQRAAQIEEWLHRLQGKTEKKVPPPGTLRWHMIGHLQRNKVKPVLPVASLIHSIDSLRLAEEIDVQGLKLGKKVPVLLQVNASEETTKSGVAVGAAVHLAEQIDSMPNVAMVGLMTMAPFEAAEAVIRQTFSRTREIFEEMKWHKIGGPGLRIGIFLSVFNVHVNRAPCVGKARPAELWGLGQARQ